MLLVVCESSLMCESSHINNILLLYLRFPFCSSQVTEVTALQNAASVFY